MSEEPKEKRPTECSIEYIMGREGYYVRKTNPLFSAVVRVGMHPEMDAVTEELTYHGKKIPGSIFRQWQTFGRQVAARAKGNSEAGLILFYHPIECKWGAFPPRQDLSVVSVDFSGVTECIQKFREENGKDWLMAGTLHTHPGDAHPSQTDVEDEKKLDGIHLIVPDFGRQKDQGIHCHIVCSGQRFVVKKPMGLLIKWEEAVGQPELEVPGSWHNQVKFGRGSSKVITYSGEGYEGGRGGYAGYGSNEHVFKGEGPRIYSATVNGVELNIVGKLFEERDGVKAVLKRLNFSKNERKFLLSNFEDDLEDILVAFDKARDALKYVKEIRGTVSDYEHERIVKMTGDAAVEILDSLVSISERMLEQGGAKTGDHSAPAGKGSKEEEVEEDKDDEKEEVEERLSDAERPPTSGVLSNDIVKAPSEFDHRELL